MECGLSIDYLENLEGRCVCYSVKIISHRQDQFKLVYSIIVKYIDID
jgi:hypothetical protein